MQEEFEDATGVTAVSIVVDSSSTSKEVQMAVSSLQPRKRTHATDPVSSTLEYYLFHDDKRSFTHLDALLTRLAPLSVVHVASTERAQPPSKNPSPAAIQKAQQVAALLEKLAGLISSRTDLALEGDLNNLVHIHPSLKKQEPLNDILEHVLEEPSLLSLRGTVLDALETKSLSLLLSSEGIHKAAPPQSMALSKGVLTSHLVLDRTASDAIHLLPPPSQLGITPSTNPNSSLYGILNRCRTAMGSRELKAWLRQPLVNLQDIQKRQDAVTFLMQSVDRIRDEALAGWTDVDLLATRLEGYKDDVTGPTTRALSCLYKLYLLASQHTPILREALEDTLGDDNDDSSTLLQELLAGIKLCETELSLSQQLVETMLDLEEAPRNFLVKSNFQSEMDEIKQELDGLEEEFDACLDGMNNEWTQVSGGKKDQVRLESLDNGDWQFRLPSTNDVKLLQARFEGVTVHRLLKNGVYFSTKPLRQLATKKQDLLGEYDKFQRQIVVDAMKIAATYAPVLERCSALVSQLDVLCSLAHVAAYSPTGYCRPTLTDSDQDGYGIELKGARHPCVELQDGIEYIPNDYSLLFGESSFLLVTGPNMGGKSTYIRALGAIVTLAQIGAYVPCTSAKINIVHHILARVGAGDVQNSGISTFMAEMLEASSILRTATKRSLIIIDELGRGTSTFDGFGLATAISEWIMERVGCMTVFATHFHELTSLEDRCKDAKNCHVTASTEGGNGLTFMYEVRPGPCLESFGIKVAEMAQVPATVVADAKRRAKLLENFGPRKKARVNDEALVNRFKNIPLDAMNDEEKKQALQQLLAQSRVNG